MGETNKDKELWFIAGAYGPVESIPLLGELIGPSLLNMVVIAYCKLGYPSGIFQNDGTIFPTQGRISLFKDYCQQIRNTEKGRLRCLTCDCQAVINFTKGTQVHPDPSLETMIREFPVKSIDELGYPREGVYCYMCHAGLLELVRAISLDFKQSSQMAIGAIWAGQNKVKGYFLPVAKVRQIAEEIEYADVDKLVGLYKKIKTVDAQELNGRAKNLSETARPIEDSASASFHVKKQGQLDRISNEMLSNLRAYLSRIKTSSVKNIQKQIYDNMLPSLEVLTNNIANSYSALCEIASCADGTKDSKTEIRIVAQTGVYKRKAEKINIRKGAMDKVIGDLEKAGDLKSLALCSSDWEFLIKLKNAIQIDDISHGIVGRIPALENVILWVTLLRSNCNVILGGKTLPDLFGMVDNVLQGITQIIGSAYLVAQQQDSVRILEEQKKELEQKDTQTRKLIENLAHQVSRPIMELKQSAYILSLGFSKDAYDSFRACLAELERGCRNFDMYERLTTDFGKRGTDIQIPSSLDVMEIANQAYIRVKPFSEVERIEIVINEDVNKGHSIPNVFGNLQAILECLVNVFHNGVKYSTGGHPVEVEISCGQSSTVDIRVSNVGIELRREDWEKIFEGRYRADTAKEVAIEGSGLGLFIARKLIALHDGSVRVESCVPGKPLEDGTLRWRTTFIISLRC